MPTRRTLFLCLGALTIVLCFVAGFHVYRTVTTWLMVSRLARTMGPPASPPERLSPPMTARYGSSAATDLVTPLADVTDPTALAAGLAPVADWAATTVRTAAFERFDADWGEGVGGIDDAQPPFMDPSSERPVVNLTGARRTGTLLTVLARRARLEGRPDEAARLLLASLALPRQLESLARREGQGFALIDAMVAVHIAGMATRELLALAEAPGLPPALLAEADRRLGAVEARFSLVGRSMALERTSSTGVFRYMNREAARQGETAAPFDVDALQAETDETMPPDATFDLPVRQAMPLWEAAAERRAELEDLGLLDYLSVLWSPARLMSRVLMAIAVPSMDRAHVREAQVRARLRGALVAWHLAAHRARGGSLPPTLAACDPGIPEPMTVDPFTGEPLAYEVVDGRATLSANSQPGSGSTKLSRLSLLPPASEP